MYGKIFESIYDGSLAEDWRALITFQQIIVLCDADGTIDMTASAISRRTGIPIEHIKAGIEILEKPDPLSRSPDMDGRRIVRLDEHRDWGWFVVNHAHYKGLQDAETVRIQTRARVQRHRDKKKAGCVTDSNGDVTQDNGQLRHTKTNKDTNTLTDLVTAEWMYQQILTLNPTHKKPNIEKWADEIRLIRERDGRSDEEIRTLFAWANNDPFWRTNILSPATLRKQWDKLVIKKAANGSTFQTPQTDTEIMAACEARGIKTKGKGRMELLAALRA